MQFLLKLLGIGNGAGVASSIMGGVNYVTIASLGTWAWVHRDEVITFNMSLGTLGLIVGACLFMLELNRRTPPPYHPPGQE
jgi:hypothetical protein